MAAIFFHTLLIRDGSIAESIPLVIVYKGAKFQEYIMKIIWPYLSIFIDQADLR